MLPFLPLLCEKPTPLAVGVSALLYWKGDYERIYKKRIKRPHIKYDLEF